MEKQDMQSRDLSKIAGLNNCMCPTDPDLILLRKNAIGEREAIHHYLCAADKVSGAVCKLFRDIAHDEMIHFRRNMMLLSQYDPVQDCAFSDDCINLPPVDSFRKSKNCTSFEIMALLTESIADELAAINQYQESYCCAKHEDVKIFFCETGNDEKMHVSQLWKCLMAYTSENICKP